MSEDKKQRIRIIQNDDPIDPRKEYDHFGTLVCWHPRYTLGDEQPDQRPTDWFNETINDETDVCLPVYLYDHSGITISINEFSCPFDSGMIGWIYAKADQMEKEGFTKEESIRNLEREIKEYDQFLRGDIWGYVLEECIKCDSCGHEEWEVLEACGGFYGYNPKENGMADQFPDNWESILIERG